MMPDDPQHAATAEEACLAGWPALREVLFDGWMLRFSEGCTRRANSINVVGPSRKPAPGKIEACEALYRAEGLPAVFRLSSVRPHDDLSAALDAAGYGPPEDPTLVLWTALSADHRAAADGVTVTTGRPGAAWLAAAAALGAAADPKDAALRARIFDALVVPAAFAAVSIAGEVAAVAFGAVHDGVVCLNGVATAPALRGQGLAGRAVSAVTGWAAGQAGATAACLPVGAHNQPARKLYARLGFVTEVCRYHYRQRAGA